MTGPHTARPCTDARTCTSARGSAVSPPVRLSESGPVSHVWPTMRREREPNPRQSIIPAAVLS
eukprot:1340830-Prymnesium_polylepis.1